MDNLNIDAHTRYAVDTVALENFKGKYRIGDFTDTRAISDHAKVLDYVPKPGAFAQLFKINNKRLWAYFDTPQNFSTQRVFFFSSIETVEKDETDLKLVASIDINHPDSHLQSERDKEKQVLLDFCKLKVQLREDYNYIVYRVHQFVQG